MKKCLPIIPLVIILCFGCKEDSEIDLLLNDPQNLSDSVRINEIQVIGSHNSYRLRTYGPILQAAMTIAPLLPGSLNPEGWDYTHLPLEEQFGDFKIRQIELDIYYDPDGGRFANRAGNVLASEPVESGIPELEEPGFKVLHVPDLDYMTNYYTLKHALETVKNWSEAHPKHLPIFILIEAKDQSIGSTIPGVNVTDVLEFDIQALADLDQEIRDVFGADLKDVITPDIVRGNHSTLKEAIQVSGWPKIAEARGKVIFLLDNGGSVKNLYLQGHPSLSGRILFTDSGSDKPESAFVKQNDAQGGSIEQLVAEGFIVRTRADNNTQEARTGDIANREAAFSRGAQLISTDYYQPDPRYIDDDGWTDYSVQIPGGGVARLNPINSPNLTVENFE